MDPPTVISMPSRWKKRRLRYAVVHSMGEYVVGSDGVARHAPKHLDFSKLSCHAFCTPTGEIIQSVPTEFMAWHVKGHNSESIGLEFLVPGEHTWTTFLKAINGSTDPYAEVQYRAAGWWFGTYMKQWGLELEDLVGHHHLNSEKPDPGRAFNWIKLRDYVQVFKG